MIFIIVVFFKTTIKLISHLYNTPYSLLKFQLGEFQFVVYKTYINTSEKKLCSKSRSLLYFYQYFTFYCIDVKPANRSFQVPQHVESGYPSEKPTTEPVIGSNGLAKIRFANMATDLDLNVYSVGLAAARIFD